MLLPFATRSPVLSWRMPLPGSHLHPKLVQVLSSLHSKLKYKKPHFPYKLYQECGFSYLSLQCTRCPVLTKPLVQILTDTLSLALGPVHQPLAGTPGNVDRLLNGTWEEWWRRNGSLIRHRPTRVSSFAVTGTESACMDDYLGSYVVPSTDSAYSTKLVVPHTCYTVSGTDQAYGTKYPELNQCIVLR
eukprot:718677-Rhodomonas_salina.1